MREPTFRIALADDDANDRQEVKQMLEKLGHEVVAEAANGEDLIEQVARNEPDIVISDLEMPGTDGLQAADAIGEKSSTPVIIMTSTHAPATTARVLAHENVWAYVVKPFAAGMLDGILRFGTGLAGRFASLQDRIKHFQTALEERKLVERAKGVLMQSLKLAEPEAHRKLQKMASSKNLKLSDLAKSILSHEFPLKK